MESRLEIDKFCNNNTLESLKRAPEYLREMYTNLCQPSTVDQQPTWEEQEDPSISIDDICFIPLDETLQMQQPTTNLSIDMSTVDQPWVWYWFAFSMAILFVVTGSLALSK